MESPQKEHAELMMKAFEEYLEIYLLESLEPKMDYLKYNFEFLDNRKWRGFGDEMVRSDLREITNLMNKWHNHLHRWQAWNRVLDKYGDNKMQAWRLRAEFVELVIHLCLHMPISMRDMFSSVGIENFHVIRLSLDDQYKDHLVYDPKLPDLRQRPPLSRSKKEKLLSEVISVWDSEELMKSLQSLNSKEYITLTKNFRNLSSHAIAPRIASGEVSAVKRTVVRRTRMAKNENGSFREEVIPNETAVAYSFGGTPPLDVEKVFHANLKEIYKARTCYLSYRKLLENTVSQIPLRTD